MLELFCARFRQEDGFRDLKQRLGWEECRAWTKQPILRHHPGRAPDPDAAAAVTVPAGGGGGRRLVVPPAVEPAEDAPERARPGATAAAAPRGNSATSGLRNGNEGIAAGLSCREVSGMNGP